MLFDGVHYLQAGRYSHYSMKFEDFFELNEKAAYRYCRCKAFPNHAALLSIADKLYPDRLNRGFWDIMQLFLGKIPNGLR